MSEDIYHPRRRTVIDPGGSARNKYAPARTFDLGAVGDFPTLPARVRLENGEEHWLAKDRNGQYRLLSMVCPHAYGRVVKWDKSFLCPDHGWRFEESQGICVNGPRAQLFYHQVVVNNGRLVAHIPADADESVTHAPPPEWAVPK
jgi:nitrite reductase/ring-hydroxylating ferredoxin subunit